MAPPPHCLAQTLPPTPFNCIPMRHVLILCLCLATLTVAGCATIFSGTDDDITFRSEPSGAAVMIDGIMVGRTPVTVPVDRPGLEDTRVTVELDGYDPMTFELDKEFNMVSILNVFVWPGFIVDALTGALFKYDRTAYTVDLDDGSVTLNLDGLPRTEDGAYLVPNTNVDVLVVDETTGLQLRFK